MKNNLLQFPLNIVLSYLLLIYLFVHPSDSPFLTTSFQSQSWPTSIEMKNLLLAFLAIPLTSCSISPLLYMQWERIKSSGSIRHDYNFFFFFQKKRHKYSLLKLSNKPFAVCPNFSVQRLQKRMEESYTGGSSGADFLYLPHSPEEPDAKSWFDVNFLLQGVFTEILMCMVVDIALIKML